MTANQDLFDAALRHQVALRRYSDRQRRQMLDLLEAADADLVAKLRARLGEAMEGGATNRRLNALLKEVRDTRRALIDSLAQDTTAEMEALAAAEAAWEQQIMAEAVPVEMSTTALPLERLRAAAVNSPMQGKRLTDWFRHLGDGDRARLDQAVRLGVANGETLDDIVRRIAGTRANGYTDGILATTRREAETIARTAVNHTSNAARSEVWDANQDIIWGLRWTSTLDGRTSPICQARDGDIAVNPGREVPPGTPLLDPQEARPPAHPNCRSLMVAMLSPDMVIGDRPFVRDARTREERERDFRAQARDADPEAWRAMSPQERNAEVKRVRDAWADENIGTVPASTTYEEWMRRQPAEFQDATLGPSRAEMFRNGDVKLDQFTDVGGRTRTLSELDNLVRAPRGATPELAQSIRDLPAHPTIPGAVVSPIPGASSRMNRDVRSIPFDTLMDARNGRIRLPVSEVQLEEVYTNQPEVGPEALLGIAAAELDELLPLLIEVEGGYVVDDGNHRTVLALLRGERAMRARILKAPDG